MGDKESHMHKDNIYVLNLIYRNKRRNNLGNKLRAIEQRRQD